MAKMAILGAGKGGEFDSSPATDSLGEVEELAKAWFSVSMSWS